MKEQPKFITDKIEKPEESKSEKDVYQATVEAVDDLTMALNQDWTGMEGTIRERVELVHKNLRQAEKERDFFEILPLALKMNRLKSITNATHDTVGAKVPEGVELLSEDGYAILSNGIQEILRENKELPALEQGKISDLVQALVEVFIKGNFYTASGVYDFLEKYKAQLERMVEAPGFDEVKDDYAQLTAFLESGMAREHFASLIDKESYRDENFLKKNEKAREFVVRTLKQYGLSEKAAADILQSWLTRENDKESVIKNFPPVYDNFRKMEILSQESSGAVKFLYEKLGIRNFDRYTPSLLRAQLEDFENLEKPYGIVINPTNDWNGAFSERPFVWHDLLAQLREKGYALRVMECGSKIELARRLIGLDRKYGKSHKISFAFVGGHGTRSSIKFGGNKSINTLDIGDLTRGSGAKKSSKFFEDSPTIVLISCFTGVDGGIGEQLSETLGAEVIAPDKPTNISQVTVSKGERGLEFYIKYSERESTKVFKKSKKD